MVEQVIHTGETYEQVLVSEPSVAYRFVQEAHSVLRLHVVDFTSAENEITIEQNGEGCATELYVLAYVGEAAIVRTHTRVHHNIGGGTSKQLVKYVLSGEAKGEYFGELKIVKDAQKTTALQTNRNLLLSESATMRTRPQLEIYADDVKASHGASTGQLDESALFYMQQRCLSPNEGRKLLLQAFMADVLDTITDDNVRESVMTQLEKQMENN